MLVHNSTHFTYLSMAMTNHQFIKESIKFRTQSSRGVESRTIVAESMATNRQHDSRVIDDSYIWIHQHQAERISQEWAWAFEMSKSTCSTCLDPSQIIPPTRDQVTKYEPRRNILIQTTMTLKIQNNFSILREDKSVCIPHSIKYFMWLLNH